MAKWAVQGTAAGPEVLEIDPAALGHQFNVMYPNSYDTEAQALAAAPKVQDDFVASEKERLGAGYDAAMATQAADIKSRSFRGFRYPAFVFSSAVHPDIESVAARLETVTAQPATK